MRKYSHHIVGYDKNNKRVIEQRVIVHNRLTPNDNNFFFTLHDTILSQSYIEKLELSTIVLRHFISATDPCNQVSIQEED